MNAVRPQFINNLKGHREWVVLPVKEFDLIMEELEEIEDIRLYDKIKSSKQEYLPAQEVFQTIDAKRKK